MSPTFLNLPYSYKKTESDVWVLNSADIPVPQELIKDQQLVYFAPSSVGGNHRHQRTEWFIGMGELVFIWLDENGQSHEEPLHPDKQLRLVTVPPFLPHAVVNRSSTQSGVLFELADSKVNHTQKVPVVES